ncbi:hypothetical protein [Lacisediminimonas profundi]|nr:hypothetical protein [Lacisediminimonas profundi]
MKKLIAIGLIGLVTLLAGCAGMGGTSASGEPDVMERYVNF